MRLSLTFHALLAFATLLTPPGCKRLEERVVHRQNCLVCHRPLGDDFEPHGIEDAHPWHELSCTDCHGGNGFDCDGTLIPDPAGGDPACDGSWVYDQNRAHVPPANSPVYLKELTPEQLDDADRDYLRFINPGDLRVVQFSCASCHTNIANAVGNSKHNHGAGEYAAPRFRAGAQPDPGGRFGTTDASDNTPVVTDSCSVGVVAGFSPPPVLPESPDPLNAPTAANMHEQILAKRCGNCHISSFGDNNARGTFRSSGCSACHMPYAEDGLSQSDDPWVNKTEPARPVKHTMETVPPLETCVACHLEGARIGLSYQGIREVGEGGVPPNGFTLGQALYGKGPDHYVFDEDTTNGFDETPADVHFDAGMHCMDCHTKTEVHGDGHIYGQASCTVTTRCEDCHGTAQQRAGAVAWRDNLSERDGKLILTTKRDGIELEVPQVADAATIPGHSAAHLGAMECVSCHASWMPNCYGCHVEMDLTGSQAYTTSGQQVPGTLSETSGPVALWDLTLVQNTRGKYMPSMPAQKLFMTLHVLDTEQQGVATRVLFGKQPRTWTDPDTGRTFAAFGQRPVDPHTTRRVSPYQACDRCHTVGDPAAPDNAALLDITHGFGSQRFPYTGCDVTNADDTCDEVLDTMLYQRDAVIDAAGNPLVVIGQPNNGLTPARPLTLEEIDAMRAVTVEAQTPVPEGAESDPSFPGAPQR